MKEGSAARGDPRQLQPELHSTLSPDLLWLPRLRARLRRRPAICFPRLFFPCCLLFPSSFSSLFTLCFSFIMAFLLALASPPLPSSFLRSPATFRGRFSLPNSLGLYIIRLLSPAISAPNFHDFLGGEKGEKREASKIGFESRFIFFVCLWLGLFVVFFNCILFYFYCYC